MVRPSLDLAELAEARLEAQEMPTRDLLQHFATLLVGLEEAGGLPWLSPEETRATWEQLAERGHLAVH